jgi:hypothetical protein
MSFLGMLYFLCIYGSALSGFGMLLAGLFGLAPAAESYAWAAAMFAGIAASNSILK